jgi:hypothetical protein
MIKTGVIPHKTVGGYISSRAGTRTTRTRAKTAHALGHNYTPTGSWRTRSQGQKSTKMVKAGEMKKLKKQVKEISTGDQKPI